MTPQEKKKFFDDVRFLFLDDPYLYKIYRDDMERRCM